MNSSLMKQLITSVEADDEDELKKELRALVSQGQSIELDSDCLHVLERLLTLGQKTPEEVRTLTANAIAELAKSESNRKVLSVDSVISYLLSLLRSNERTTRTQACRGLGNLCFENPEARKLVAKNDGLVRLLASIEQPHNDVDARAVAFGFLLNLLINNDDLQKEAVSLKLIDTIEAEVEAFLIVEPPHTVHALTVLNMLTEHLGDTWLSPSLCANLAALLRLSENGEVAVMCLEIIHGQLGCEETKTCLADRGICESIYELVEKYKCVAMDEDEQAILKMACDVVVLILTGDDAMYHLYDNGKGVTYRNMLSWLKSDNDDLLSTGVLALGNFARDDAHCVQMVEDGLAISLIDLLARRKSDDKDTKLQYAILSAVRNLAILPQNKSKLITSGLIPIILEMLDNKQSHVTFKLLGTLRIVIDGQEKEASTLLSDEHLLKKIAHWYSTSDHVGVRGEASRLLAWLIKNGRSFNSYCLIIDTDGCLRCLVEMLSSNYLTMQNEAIFALTLLLATTACKTPVALDEVLGTLDLGEHVKFLFSKHKDATNPEIIENSITLCERLCELKLASRQLKDTALMETLDELLLNCTVKKLDKVTARVEQLRRKLRTHTAD